MNAEYRIPTAGSSIRLRTWLLAVVLFTGLLVAWIMNIARDESPVDVAFVSWTNYRGRTIALFGITNHLDVPVRGYAFVQTNTPSGWPDPQFRLETVRSMIGGPTGISTAVVTRVVAWSSALEFSPGRDMWLGASNNFPHNGMTIGLPQPAVSGSWKPALYLTPDGAVRIRQPRKRAAEFLMTHGLPRLGQWLRPPGEPLLVYGPEMKNPAD